MRFNLFIIGLLFSIGVFSQNKVYRTQPLSGDIYTIQVNAGGNWQDLPVIALQSNDYIRVNFDRLGDAAFNMLKYRVKLCNADWTEASLSEIDFIEGFNNNYINDYAPSLNTSVEYCNYNLELPNKDIRLKISGNYVVEVYDENQSEKILLTACFSVLDQQIKMTGQYSTNTDIDTNKQHQQVSFAIDYSRLNARDIVSELKVFVNQNNRLDTQRKIERPTRIQANKLIYDHNRELIFEAGNEYRRFEIVDRNYNGMNVESIEYLRPYYFATLRTGKIRANKSYVYDQDQNGRFVVRNVRAQEHDTEADYFVVDFSLEAANPFNGDVYLNGSFTYDLFTDKYKMNLDNVNDVYSQQILMKQGSYNYQYLVKKGTHITSAPTEGNYYETNNEYCVLVYYRSMGSRYDALIGILLISDK